MILLSLVHPLQWLKGLFFTSTVLHSISLNLFFLLWNTIVRLTVFLIIVYLLSALKDAYERQKTLARIDGLTQIYNRRYFLEILQVETKRALRYQRCLRHGLF